MPIPIALQGIFEGVSAIPYFWTVVKIVPWLLGLYVLKVFFGGARNTSERNMHSKVVMITVSIVAGQYARAGGHGTNTGGQGGTSGIGAAVAQGLASRGAQLVLLTQYSLTDPFLADYIMDLREQTNNELITAEQVDLSSLNSIRVFATKWIDNAPPRRLDMIILCADTMTPKGAPIRVSQDGVESNFAINYLANFHLLSILSPAIRAQPPDRDVRIVFGTCSSYMGGQLPEHVPLVKQSTGSRPLVAADPAAAYSSSKLALMTFASAFQKHLASYERPDKQPNNARVIMVDPGWSRTPGMRRFLTRGRLRGLAVYMLLWPLWWLILKSPVQGAQTFFYAAMEAEFGRGQGGLFLKEVKEIQPFKDEVRDEGKQKKLWQVTEKAIEKLEKESAVQRANEKKAKAQEDSQPSAKAQEGTNPSTQENGGVATGSDRQPGSRRSRKSAK